MQYITIKHKHNEIQQTKQSHILNLLRIHRKTITISVTMISTILIIGYLLDSVSSPNATMGSIFDPLPVYDNGLGAVNGYVFTSSGLPALGTIVIAAGQDGLSKTTRTDLTQEGKYVFQNLNPGKYVIIAYFPDGEYKVMNNLEVEPNSVQTLIFKH
ncbi:hypothetical protein NMY3_01110 [Candidatus Nitrosocosmicus oleophilus]|jgi:hypothetical protein|uniref:Cna protein B-type domain protein n=1 Tax=Candidatus Nitrosocosmicus oleophilus TaxID=1353260 RepID=A0A654LVT7_9ARCH|nr:carboxypeptidase-like regulatory domain-containing protein [Candidatus Nitrosocosmicus oleophilus]ALI35315.1 hypothetical protein NMY3_01110 [Candidatus Nitrosocosmicus oleophilus]